jgi:hypothetical protein
MRTIAVVFIVTFATQAFSQTANSRNQQRASRQAYQYGVETSRRQINAEMSWQNSKKITILKESEYPRSPRSSVRVGELKKGEPALLEAWQFKVISVPDAKNVLLGLGESSIWLENHRTEGLFDGDNARILGAVVMVGTKNYESETGASIAVPLVRLGNAKENADFEAKLKQKQLEIEQIKLLKEYPRWSLADGTVFQGKFDRYVGQKVRFDMPSGDQVAYSLSELSKDSAEAIRELIRKSRR